MRQSSRLCICSALPFAGPGEALLLYYSTNLVEEQGHFSEMNFCCQKYSLSSSRAQPVLPQGRTAIFVADASVFGVFVVSFNFSHLKGEELTVIHLSTQQQKGEKHLWTLLPFTGVFTCAFWGQYPCPPGRGGGARQPWTALRHCGSGRGPWRQRHADR